MKVVEDRPPSDRHLPSDRNSDRRTAARRSGGKPGKRKIRVPQNARLVRFFLHPVGRILVAAIVLLLIGGVGVFVHYYTVVFEDDRRAADRRPLQHHRPHLCGAGNRLGRRQVLALRSRRGSAARRLQREPQQSGRLLYGYRGIHRYLPRRGRLFRSGAGHRQVRRRQNHPHRLPSRQYRPAALRARAAAHHEPLQRQPRKTARSALRRHPARAAKRHTFRRG